MTSQRLVVLATAAAFAAALVAGRGADVAARQGSTPPSLGTSASLNGLLSSTLVFAAADADKDGLVTRDELKAASGRWFTAADAANAGSVTLEQLSGAPSSPGCSTRSAT